MINWDNITIPDGCHCDIHTWDETLKKLPDPCRRYNAPRPNMYCVTCGHDEQCHVKSVEDGATKEKKLDV